MATRHGTVASGLSFYDGKLTDIRFMIKKCSACIRFDTSLNNNLQNLICRASFTQNIGFGLIGHKFPNDTCRRFAAASSMLRSTAVVDFAIGHGAHRVFAVYQAEQQTKKNERRIGAKFAAAKAAAKRRRDEHERVGRAACNVQLLALYIAR